MFINRRPIDTGFMIFPIELANGRAQSKSGCCRKIPQEKPYFGKENKILNEFKIILMNFDPSYV